MRKGIVCISLLSICLFSSCKKEQKNFSANTMEEIAAKSAFNQISSNQAYVDNVLNWLENQKSTYRNKSVQKIKALIDNLDVSRIKTESFTQSEQFIIIPIKGGYNNAINIESSHRLNLVLFSSISGEIKGGRLIEFILEQEDELNAPVFTNLIMGRFPGVNARFKISSLDGTLINQMTFKNDRIFSYGIVKPKLDAKNSERVTPPGCIDYYLYEEWYDEDGNVIDYQITYLYTECDGTSGGGGGDGYPGNQCNMMEQEAADLLASVTTTVSSNGGSTSGTQTGPDANGKITRPVTVKRHQITYHYWGGYSATYTLFFPGVLFKNSPNDAWKWESINFSQFALTSGGAPPCLEQENSPTVAITISGDKLKATFTAVIASTLKISCAFGLVIANKQEDLNGIYPASDF